MVSSPRWGGRLLAYIKKGLFVEPIPLNRSVLTIYHICPIMWTQSKIVLKPLKSGSSVSVVSGDMRRRPPLVARRCFVKPAPPSVLTNEEHCYHAKGSGKIRNVVKQPKKSRARGRELFCVLRKQLF